MRTILFEVLVPLRIVTSNSSVIYLSSAAYKASSLMIFRPMDFLSATLLTALPRLATVKKSLSAVEHNLHFWMSHQNCSAGQRRLPPAAGI
jgi:hypothetical protein